MIWVLLRVPMRLETFWNAASTGAKRVTPRISSSMEMAPGA